MKLLARVTFGGISVNMADVNLLRPAPIAASPQFLREAEIRRGIELLYFGYSNMVKGADARLAEHGLGRAHHRALYFIARRPGLPIGDLLDLLTITKQSLSRVLGDLQSRALVAQTVGTRDRRQRMLRLTAAGGALENELFECLRDGVTRAYGHAGQNAVTGFWTVLTGLIPPGDRPLIEALQSEKQAA